MRCTFLSIVRAKLSRHSSCSTCRLLRFGFGIEQCWHGSATLRGLTHVCPWLAFRKLLARNGFRLRRVSTESPTRYAAEPWGCPLTAHGKSLTGSVGDTPLALLVFANHERQM